MRTISDEIMRRHLAPSEQKLFLVRSREETEMRKLWAALATIIVLFLGWPVAEDGFIGSVIFFGTLCILAFWWWVEIKLK